MSGRVSPRPARAEDAAQKAALAAAGAFLLALSGTSACMHRYALTRQSPRDWNYDPATDEREMTPSGDSPLRRSALEGNIWWNKQPLERLEVRSEDGLALVGHLLRADAPTNRLAFVIHGHQCVSGEMGFIARMFHNRGYHVFMPDQRAHGKSGGKYIGMGWLEKRDMLRWLNRLIALLGPELKIVLHGISMGAATVMMTVGEPELPAAVRCAVEDCGYTSAYDSFLFHMQRDMKPVPFKRLIISTASLLNRLTSGYGFKQAETVGALRRSRTPMLFIHGTHDNVVPFEMMRQLYDACAAPRGMYVVENAAHGVCYFADPTQYEKTVFAFIEPFLR